MAKRLELIGTTAIKTVDSLEEEERLEHKLEMNLIILEKM